MIEIVNIVKTSEGEHHESVYGPLSEKFKTLSRLIDISSLASFLRNFPINVLTDDEKQIFFGFQNFIIELESKCFDEAGFI